MFPVLERRRIAGYVTECKGENSRKEQTDVVWWFSRLVVSVFADNKITKQQISKQQISKQPSFIHTRSYYSFRYRLYRLTQIGH